ASIEPCIAVLHPPELLKSLPECCEERGSFQVVLGIAHQYADPPHTLGWLCACRSQPCRRRAAEKPNEFTTSHRFPEEPIAQPIRAGNGDRRNGRIVNFATQEP